MLNLHVTALSSSCMRPFVRATSLLMRMGFSGPWASGCMTLMWVSMVPVLLTLVSNISAHLFRWSWPRGVLPFLVYMAALAADPPICWEACLMPSASWSPKPVLKPTCFSVSQPCSMPSMTQAIIHPASLLSRPSRSVRPLSIIVASGSVIPVSGPHAAICSYSDSSTRHLCGPVLMWNMVEWSSLQFQQGIFWVLVFFS